MPGGWCLCTTPPRGPELRGRAQQAYRSQDPSRGAPLPRNRDGGVGEATGDGLVRRRRAARTGAGGADAGLPDHLRAVRREFGAPSDEQSGVREGVPLLARARSVRDHVPTEPCFDCAVGRVHAAREGTARGQSGVGHAALQRRPVRRQRLRRRSVVGGDGTARPRLRPRARTSRCSACGSPSRDGR